MSYATTSDLIARFGSEELRQITDIEIPAAAAVVDSVAQRALDDASALVDSRIGGRYTVPLSAAYPTEVVRVVCDIARYMLHDLGAPDAVRKRYEDAVRWLDALAAGKFPLVGQDGSPLPTRSDAYAAGAVRAYARHAVFADAFAAAWKP